jgi:WD40 repeat protein
VDVTDNNKTLISTDSMGFVYVWSIDDYAVEHPEDDPPDRMSLTFSDLVSIFVLLLTVQTMWRGHVESVTSTAIVEEHKMVVTSSLDCTVRMWTFDGEYVGKPGHSLILLHTCLIHGFFACRHFGTA